MSEQALTTEIRLMDEADARQIIAGDDAVKQALAYEDRDRKRHISYAGVKAIVLHMSQEGQAMRVIQHTVALEKDDPENQTMWFWRAQTIIRNEASGLETIGVSESPYLAGKFYDNFGRTKASSKAERNALRKQIPEANINRMLNAAKGEELQPLHATVSEDRPAPAQAAPKPPAPGPKIFGNGDAEPSDAQKNYLASFERKGLWKGTPPATKGEMSALLGQLREKAEALAAEARERRPAA